MEDVIYRGVLLFFKYHSLRGVVTDYKCHALSRIGSPRFFAPDCTYTHTRFVPRVRACSLKYIGIDAVYIGPAALVSQDTYAPRWWWWRAAIHLIHLTVGEYPQDYVRQLRGGIPFFPVVPYSSFFRSSFLSRLVYYRIHIPAHLYCAVPCISLLNIAKVRIIANNVVNFIG